MPDARASQAAALIVERYEPVLTFDCQLWLITRRDGQQFAYTSHDQNITYRDIIFRSCRSLQASAIELGAFMDQTGNLDLQGIITDDRITERDLFGGLFDGASIEIWRYYWTGQRAPMRLTAGIAGKVTQNDQDFRLEALTPRARLEQQALLEAVTPTCRWKALGDERCKVNLYPYTQSGEVSAIAARSAYPSSQRRIFWDDGRGEAAGYWSLGTLTWLTGDNEGLTSEVKDFADGQFVLWEPMPYAIAPGDGYEVTPGCDRTKPTCISKFNNLINFGGFPDIPGKDAMMRVPEAKNA